MEQIRIAVNEVFGYCSIPVDEVVKYKLDLKVLVNENDWTLIEGTLVHGILIEKAKIDLEFGSRPDNKTLKRMAKEQKYAQESES